MFSDKVSFMSLTYWRDFQNHHQLDLAGNMFLNDVETIFFYMFIMCFFFKGYNKDNSMESVIWLHCKSLTPYIIYSNKPRKRYVLDTRVLFAKIPVIYNALISSFPWVVYGLYAKLERCNCWLSQFISWHWFYMKLEML